MARLLIMLVCLIGGTVSQDSVGFNAYSTSVIHASGLAVPVAVQQPVGADTNCALDIPGVGHSSQFDHVRGVFHGQPEAAFQGGVTCVTFAAVSAAFDQAAAQHRLRRPDGELDVEDVGELGAVLTEVARVIAQTYNLPRDVVAGGLPLIDTLRTSIAAFCPAFLTDTEPCQLSRYRTIDGTCNNLDNPRWGAARGTFRRLLAPNYSDGVSAPVVGAGGYPLPSARVVSATLHRDLGKHDHAVTVMLVAWGQLIDHDITLTGELKPVEIGRNGRPQMPDCCNDPRQANNPLCFPIEIPADDPFYRLHGQTCMNVIRSLPGVHNHCRLGPRDAINAVSSYLDASFVYGSDAETTRRIRTHRAGLLKTLPVFREHGLKDLLPPNLHAPDEGCIRPSNEIYCFDAGDMRVNEQLVLAILQTFFMREHNRIATELGYINPHWDDETIFQESRRIVGATVQQITFNEFLPMVLGKDVMIKENMIIGKGGRGHTYKPTVNSASTDTFATAAFRFGHSLLPSTIERWSTTGKYIDSRRLSEMLRQPYDMYKTGFVDQYTVGLISQLAQAMDDAITQEVTNHLFQMPEDRFGMDLAAINMQRGREHGLPGYNRYRQLCGLPRITDFNQLIGVMTNTTATNYGRVYSHPDDIDLWSGLVSERPLPGSMIGPTLACLIAEQFRVLKEGDRFWFENQGHPGSFTLGQMEQIRKVKLSTLVCDNTDRIERVQVYAMVLPDALINPHVPCASLPRLDLTAWRDLSGSHLGK